MSSTSTTTTPGTTHATTPRDRLPVPPSQHYVPSPPSARNVPSMPSTTLPSAASLASNATLLLDPLLETHASAPDPTFAALEQALQERNTLSSQNSQLWKLIEKQRTAYHNLMKENERIRGERDAYKAKVSALGPGVPENSKKRDRDKDRERHLRPAVSSPSLAASGSNGPSNDTSLHGSGLGATRDHVDETRRGLLVPSSSSEPSSANILSSSRPLTPRSRSEDTAPVKNSQVIRLQTNFDDRQPLQSTSPSHSSPRKVSPSPLVITTRSHSLSPDSATKTDSPSRRLPGSSESSLTGPYVPVYSSVGSTPVVQPLQMTRKSSHPLSTENGNSSATSLTEHSQPSPSIPAINLNDPSSPSSHSHSQSQPVYPSSSPSGSSQSLQTHHSSFSLPLSDAPQVSASSPSKSHPPTQSPQPKNLMLTPDVSGRQLSRESRVSIPYEARQYIASMGDSPRASPLLESHTPSPSQSTSGDQKRHEFTLGQAQQRHTDEPNLSATFIAEETPAGASGDSTPSDFLDLETDDGADDEDMEEDAGMGAVSPTGAAETGKSQADDFPLPPSFTDPQAHAQARAMAQAHAQAHAQAQAQQLQSQTPTQQARGAMRPPELLMPPGLHPSPSSSPVTDMSSVSPITNKSASFRALPLLPTDLPKTQIQVAHSSIRPNDRGKEVLSFVVHVDPGNGKESWKVEKLWSDVLGLDQRIRSSVGKGVVKKIGTLPEGKLWRDHAPAKVDQRKAALETYLQSLINLPIKNKDEVVAFFTSDIVRETQKPVTRAGYKEGYLTKRGKNFGGWKTRYFVLQGPVLEYYESRGGTHLGSIVITGAQIGRQQRVGERAEGEKEYRHAFLVIEAKKSPGGGHRHVLCAESDQERDSWVSELVRYVMGSYNEEGGAQQLLSSASQIAVDATAQPRSSISSNDNNNASSSSSSNNGAAQAPAGRRPPVRGMSKDDSPRVEIAKGAAVPISQLPPDAANAKLFNTPNLGDLRNDSPVKESPTDGSASAKRLLQGNQSGSDAPLSSSLPTSSPLDGAHGELVEVTGQRSNSELGHYADMQGRDRHISPDRHRGRERKSYHPTLQVVASSPVVERTITPDPSTPARGDPNGKVKISAPKNGIPIPPGYKFGKEPQTEALTPTNADRKEKAKSRGFWGFGRPYDKPHPAMNTHVPRAVFGVTLDEAYDVAEIDNLPAIVHRCIQYLEAKKAEQEEGIYRLSGSTAVIKSLKDRFNMEGDVDLLSSDEFWDPHAIAGLLKCFLRELPASILTRELHLRFLAVIDFVNPQERINELSQLIKALPLANYSLLRALTAHLILIVQNSSVNKMTMRNVGIVFSPTLGIPAGVFSLMLGEFNRVFNVDEGRGDGYEQQRQQERTPRQSNYQQTVNGGSADQQAWTTLAASPEDAPSDSDDFFVTDDSGTENTENDVVVVDSSPSVSPDSQVPLERQTTVTSEASPATTAEPSRASQLAATRGLSVALSERGNRHSRIVGLPVSPRLAEPIGPSASSSSQSQ